MSKIRARVVVEGRVQGVFFRDSTRKKADEEGVQGFVRNLGDGSVEAVLEGDNESVEAVLAFMRVGPQYANVTSVNVLYSDYRGEYSEFFIARNA